MSLPNVQCSLITYPLYDAPLNADENRIVGSCCYIIYLACLSFHRAGINLSPPDFLMFFTMSEKLSSFRSCLTRWTVRGIRIVLGASHASTSLSTELTSFMA